VDRDGLSRLREIAAVGGIKRERKRKRRKVKVGEEEDEEGKKQRR
jgi:hypothetical protein